MEYSYSLALLHYTPRARVLPFRVTKGVLMGQKIGQTTLGGLMEKFYRPILEKAKREGIPILDMANTFNPHEDLYLAQIEPNEAGGKLIAQGINLIVKKHNFSGDSLIFSHDVKPNDPANWRVTYLERNE